LFELVSHFCIAQSLKIVGVTLIQCYNLREFAIVIKFLTVCLRRLPSWQISDNGLKIYHVYLPSVSKLFVHFQNIT